MTKLKTPCFLLVAALALAACNTTTGDQPGPGVATGSTGPATASAAPEKPAEPMTRTQAASECWMKTEKDASQKNLDARLAVVEKCIADKTKGAQAKPKT